MLKRLGAILLIAALLLSLCACTLTVKDKNSDKDEDEDDSTPKPTATVKPTREPVVTAKPTDEPTDKPDPTVAPTPTPDEPSSQVTDADGSSVTEKLLGNLFGNGDTYYFSFYSETDIGYGVESVLMTFIKKGYNYLLDMESDSTHIGMMVKDGDAVLIMHDTSNYAYTDQMAIEEFENLFDLLGDESVFDGYSFESGLYEVDDGELYYEVFENSVETVEFYYSKDKKTWLYFYTGDDTWEVNGYGNDVDNSVFTIPSGYSEIYA